MPSQVFLHSPDPIHLSCWKDDLYLWESNQSSHMASAGAVEQLYAYPEDDDHDDEDMGTMDEMTSLLFSQELAFLFESNHSNDNGNTDMNTSFSGHSSKSKSNPASHFVSFNEISSLKQYRQQNELVYGSDFASPDEMIRLSPLDFLQELVSSSDDEEELYEHDGFDGEEVDDDDQDEPEEDEEEEGDAPEGYEHEDDEEGADELDDEENPDEDQEDPSGGGDDGDDDGEDDEDEEGDPEEYDEEDEEDEEADDEIQIIGERKRPATSKPHANQDTEDAEDDDDDIFDEEDEDDYPEEDYEEEDQEEDGASIDLGDESETGGADEDDDEDQDTQNKKRAMGGKVGNPNKKSRLDS